METNNNEASGMREIDAAIMDFQMHVREVTGGNTYACVDSTELKQAIRNMLSLLQSQLLERVEEKRKPTRDLASKFETYLTYLTCLQQKGFNSGIDASKEEINQVFKDL